MGKAELRKYLTTAVTATLLAIVFWRVDLSEFAARYSALSWPTTTLLLLLMVLIVLLVSVRFFLLTRVTGVTVPFFVALRANISGLLSGLVVVNILGVTLGRYLILHQYGVQPTSVAVITFFERLLLALVGGGLFACGIIGVFGAAELSAIVGIINLPGTLIVVLFVLVMMTTFFRSHHEMAFLSKFAKWKYVGDGAILLAISFATQTLMLFAYVVAAQGIGFGVPVISILAASAIVSFAASIPITVNGWGVREMAAVYVFGQLGMDEANALFISVLIGLVSTAAVLISAPILFLNLGGDKIIKTGEGNSPQLTRASVYAIGPGIGNRPIHSLRRSESWLALAAAVALTILVFFQIHVELRDTPVSVNLADPLVILGMSAILLTAMRNRDFGSALPRPFLFWLFAISCLLLVSFIVGLTRLGLTSWALNNRIFGWGVLLGYVGLAATFVRFWGQHGLRRLCEVMLLTAVGCVIYTVAYREAGRFIEMPHYVLANLEGFASNRNAFAFQLLIAICGGLAYSKVMARAGRENIWSALLGIVLLGLWLTQSRTGLFVGVTILIGATLANMADRRLVTRALIWAVALSLMHSLFEIVSLSGGIGNSFTILHFHSSGIAERWLSLRGGLELWLQHPLFGAGLGAFADKRLGIDGGILVIHSIPIWILAEFGFVGLVVVASLPAALAYRMRRIVLSSMPPHATFLACCVCALLLFGLLHDMSYQRTFWLALGAASAAVALRRRPYATRRRVLSETRLLSDSNGM